MNKIRRNGNGKTLIYFGRIAKNKRIDKLLILVKILKEQMPDIRFFVVGADWGELKILKELANSLGINKNVVFTGEVSEKRLFQLMSKSDLFVLASEYEGFGISVIEAMASGLPVIVNDIETMEELVQNRKNGFKVDFNDYGKVAEIVLKLLKDKTLRKKIEKSNRIYTRKFDWNIIAKKFDLSMLGAIIIFTVTFSYLILVIKGYMKPFNECYYNIEFALHVNPLSNFTHNGKTYQLEENIKDYIDSRKTVEAINELCNWYGGWK